ncbi:MAG TPA: class I SAM-dependent methyltransferase [Actinomycetota bacterium]|jgi:SAM-dependent methyltransferase|nr:class I SAM-dependent methyltransferase [Actinomycetota bacterium]
MRSHPIFARAWDLLMRVAPPHEKRNREELVAMASGTVLEIGAGTGVNFPRYRDARLVVAVEPEPTMARRAQRRSMAATVPVRVLRGDAEALPFEDGVFDTVIACNVLCSVPRPARAAAELRRVLRPRGTVRFYEHVRSLSPRAGRTQDLIQPLWSRLAAGCHPNRDPVAALRGAGFEVRYRRVSVGPASPVRPHVLGIGRPR